MTCMADVITHGLMGTMLGLLLGAAALVGMAVDTKISGTKMVLVVLIIVTACGGGMALWASQGQPPIDQKIPIYSLADNAQTHGKFYLCSGRIDTVPVYSFYVRNTDQSFELRDVPVRESKIFTDSDSPYLHITRGGCISSTVSYQFHIPQGSIVEKYNLDSEY